MPAEAARAWKEGGSRCNRPSLAALPQHKKTWFIFVSNVPFGTSKGVALQWKLVALAAGAG